MCGIGGVVGQSSRVSGQTMQTMADSLLHRGPDGLGFLSWDGVGTTLVGRYPIGVEGSRVSFVHRRLAIIDLSAKGWQPMTTPDGRYQIVYNGEIYNYVELRKELAALGITFSSDCDTEVLLHGFAVWGGSVVDRVTGMFAFAVLDTAERTVTLARDPFGIKPLFLARLDDAVAFCSEIPPLLPLIAGGRRADPSAVYDYLRFGRTDHCRQTMFEAVEHVEPAHMVTIPVDRPLQMVRRRYWECGVEAPFTESFDRAVTTMRSKFSDSVRLHLRSDVPIGTALSGGIDSSAIVGVTRDVGGPDFEIRTFSYLSGDRRTDEEHWIDLVVAANGTLSHKTGLSEHELVEGLDTLVQLQGEPFANTSIAAQRRVFEMASTAGVRVVLDGQGSDEMLGGYGAFLAARAASLLRSGHVAEALRLTRTSIVETPFTTLARAVIPLLPERVAGTAGRLATGGDLPKWMNGDWFKQRGVHGHQPVAGPERASLRRAMIDSIVRTSLPALLRYEDRNSMAVSIESRVPFLTTDLVGWTLSLPEDFIIGPDGLSKRVFRSAMDGFVPEGVLERRDKIGFTTPEHALLDQLEPWVTSVLQESPDSGPGPIDLPAARQDWADVRAGRRKFDSRIWRWLNLIRWSDLFDVEFA